MILDDVFVEDYVAFDLETSGFSKVRDDILQVGVLAVTSEDFIEGEYSYLVNPNFPGNYKVPKVITELTGITSKMINEQGQAPEEVASVVNEMIRDETIVTHNGIAFDKPFWEVFCRKYDIMAPWNGRWQDTAMLYKGMVTNTIGMLSLYETFVDYVKEVNMPIRGVKFNLKFACDELGVDVSDINWHTALADSIATHRLFEQLRLELMGW